MVKQRGSGVGLYIVYLFFRVFGYLGLRFILYFVVLYFSLTTPSTKRYLREYYLLCTGKFNFFIYYQHLTMFALVFADRFLSKSFIHRYHIRYINKTFGVDDISNGAIFLFSHTGDWSMCSLSPSQTQIPINIVMQEAIKESIQQFSDSLQKIPKVNTIDISQGGIAVAIAVARALQNGEIVAMMADRILTPQGSIQVTFLGKHVYFNKNPFEVAYNRKTPLVALFSWREGDYHYSARYHWLAPYDMTVSKEEAITLAAQEYANILEKMVKEHPDQWFNHYDYFGSSHPIPAA
jgi:predicted LPLAT superfamily acyltransferase